MEKACASHGSRNTGPCASRGMPGTASVARRAAAGSTVMSGRLQVWLERLDRDLQGRVGGRAPELVAVEHHRVQPIRGLAPAPGGRIPGDLAAAERLDDAHIGKRVEPEGNVG